MAGSAAVECQALFAVLFLVFSNIRLESPITHSGVITCSPTCQMRQEELICTGNKTAKYLKEIVACVSQVPMIGVLVLKVEQVQCNCQWYRFAADIVQQNIHLMTTHHVRKCLKKVSRLCPTAVAKPVVSETADYEEIDTAAEKLSSTSKELGLSKMDTIIGNGDDWVAIQKVTETPVRDATYDKLRSDDLIYIMIIVAAVTAPVLCGIAFLVFYLSKKRKLATGFDPDKKRKKKDGIKRGCKRILKLFKVIKKSAKAKVGKHPKHDEKEDKNAKIKSKDKSNKDRGKEKGKSDKKSPKKKKSMSSMISELKKKNPGKTNAEYIENVNKLFGKDWKEFPSYETSTFQNVSEGGTVKSGQNNSNLDNGGAILSEEKGGQAQLKPRLGTSPVFSDFTSNHTSSALVSDSETSSSVPNDTQEADLSPSPQRRKSASSVNSYFVIEEKSNELCAPLMPEKVNRFEYSDKLKEHNFGQLENPSQSSVCNFNGAPDDSWTATAISSPAELGQSCTASTSGHKPNDSRAGVRHVWSAYNETMGSIPVAEINSTSTFSCHSSAVEKTEPVGTTEQRSHSVNAAEQRSHSVNARNKNTTDGVFRAGPKTVSISGEEIKSFFYHVDPGSPQNSGNDFTVTPLTDWPSAGFVTPRVEMDFNRNNPLHLLVEEDDQEEVDVDEYRSLLHYNASD